MSEKQRAIREIVVRLHVGYLYSNRLLLSAGEVARRAAALVEATPIDGEDGSEVDGGAFELTEDDAKECLRSAGFTFSPTAPFDGVAKNINELIAGKGQA